MNKVSFIIPARSGSKGIKDKNIKLFNGKPLMYWQIKAALDTGLGEVYVSSDSKEYLEIAKSYGAIGVLRPKEISGDQSSSEDAILHWISEFKNMLSNKLCFLQVTSPWITSTDILRAVDAYDSSGEHSLIFAKESHNYFYRIENRFVCKAMQGDRKMRQNMDKIVEVGAYIFDRQMFLETKNRLCGSSFTGYYVIDRELPNEIDSEMDFIINELFFDKWRGLE